MPAKALAEIVRVEMVRVVGLHVQHPSAIVRGLLYILWDVIAGIDADEVDFLEAEIVGKLHAGEGHRAARIGHLRSVCRKVESMRIALARPVIEEDRVLALLEAIAEIGREQLGGPAQRIDGIGPVLSDQVVLDHIKGRCPFKVRHLQEEAIRREGRLAGQLREIRSIQARPVANDETPRRACVVIPEISKTWAIDRLKPLIMDQRDTPHSR